MTADALVIGAGLAGTAAARSLATRGLAVIAIDRGRVGGGASGNPLAILMPQLNAARDALSRLHLLAIEHTLSELREHRRAGRWIRGRRIAALRLPQSARELERQARAVEAHDLPSCRARVVSPADASRVAGVEIPSTGVLFADAGVYCPADLCRARIEAASDRVEVIEGVLVAGLEVAGGGVRALDDTGREIARAARAVVADGADFRGWSGRTLPVRRVRGQIATVPASERTSRLRVILSASASLTPAVEGRHLIGSTFGPDDEDPAVRVEEHRLLVERIARAVPALRPESERLLCDYEARVAWRLATDDRLPCVGALGDRLYASVAHGSRGLATSGLAGELVAALVCGEDPPIDGDLIAAISPGRFAGRARNESAGADSRSSG